MDMKLNNKRTILVGLAFMSIMLFWTVYDLVIAKMLVDNFGLNQAWSGFIMALDNILALFLLPLFGKLSDKTSTKLGKRKPYVLVGTIIAAALFVGVAFFDLAQQNIVNAANISGILQNATTKDFYFEVNGVVQSFIHEGVSISGHQTMSVVATGRSTYILENITKVNPLLLIGYVVVLFFVLVAMGIYRSPAVSLMPDVTPKPLRSKANAIINLMGTLGGGISYLLVALLVSSGDGFLAKTGYSALFVVTSAGMIGLVAVFMATVKENEWVQEMLAITEEYNLDSLAIDEEGVDMTQHGEDDKMPKDVRRSFILILVAVVLWFMGYNAATSKFSVYASNHLHMTQFSLPPLIGTVMAAIAFVPIGIISSKIGRRKMIMFGIVVLTIALGAAYFITADSMFLIYVVMALVGISWASINVNSYPMVVEMSKYGNIGVYTGYYYTASMGAMIVTPILSGILMDVFGYASLFVYSAFFMALAFIPMFFVKHGEPVDIAKIEEHVSEE